MTKIKLTSLSADDMRIISALLKKEVENPVGLDGMVNPDLSKDQSLMLNFISNQLLVSVFEKRFNKLVFEDKKHQVTLTIAEAFALLVAVLRDEKNITDNLDYRHITYGGLKLNLHRDLIGLPVYDNLPF